MRFTFLAWLLVLVCAAFAVTIGYSHFRFSNYAETRAEQIMSARLMDLLEQLDSADKYVKTLESITDISAIERTRAMAEFIRLTPELINDEEALAGFFNDLSIKELYLTDKNGEIVFGYPEKKEDLSQIADETVLRECLATPGQELSLRPNSGITAGGMQYVALHRTDQPGLLILGFQGPREARAKAALSFGYLSRHYKLGESGRIVAFKDGALLGNDIPPFPTDDLMSHPLDVARKTTLGDSEYFTYAIRRNGYRLVGLLPVAELRESSQAALYPVLITNGILFACIFLLVFYLLQKLVIANISRINSSLRKITQGNLDVRIEGHDAPPEFRKLSSCINSMVDALQTYDKHSEESNRRELNLARTIQGTIIPNTFPAFPLHTEFDLYATCRQAKIVGGGFYDYFLLGDEYLCFMVADVSGTGVPAALFVLHSMSIIRELAHSGATPIDLVTKANMTLCEKRFVDMYMSLFYGVLEIHTGKLVFVNAGPPQALLQHKGGKFQPVEMSSGMELGRVPNATYATCTCQLVSGDRLFLYTKGAVQATAPDQATFGEERLRDAINSVTPRSISEVPRRVSAAHRKFTKGSEQNHDITMLALEYIGKKHEIANTTVPANRPEQATQFVNTHLETVFAAPVAMQELDHVILRVLSALPKEFQVQLHMDYDEDVAEVRLTYQAPPFNPLLQLSDLHANRIDYALTDEGNNMITLWKKLS